MTMTKKLIRPIRNAAYTLRFIEENLQLRDSPFLQFTGPTGNDCVIQTSHFTTEQLFSTNEKWADTQWIYSYETSEWIPIFRYIGDPSLLIELLDFEISLDPFLNSSLELEYSCTPKGLPREQYYKLSADGKTFSAPPLVVKDLDSTILGEPEEEKHYPVSKRMNRAADFLAKYIANKGRPVSRDSVVDSHLDVDRY